MIEREKMEKKDFVPPTKIVAGCVEIYDNVIDNSDEIIDIAEKENNWRDAQVFYGKYSSQIKKDKDIRSNVILDINQFSYTVNSKFYEMCKIVWFYVNEYAQKYHVEFNATEPCQILKYSVGEHYNPHCDAGPNIPRVISALLYLNDVEDGGETEFVNFDVKVKPKPGRLVIFPSNYAYSHAALQPQKGTKYVAVFWMRG